MKPCPRDTETMRRLGRAGGLKSGETRRLNRDVGIIWEYAREKRGIETPEIAKDGYPSVVPYMSAVTSGRLTPEQIAEAVRAWRRGRLARDRLALPEVLPFQRRKAAVMREVRLRPTKTDLPRSLARARRTASHRGDSPELRTLAALWDSTGRR